VRCEQYSNKVALSLFFISNFMKILSYLCAFIISLLLISCGGGGGSSSSTSATSSTLSGTAATGAPLVGATVNVYDAEGNFVGTTVVGADGQYSLTVGAQFKAPFTVEVQGVSGDGGIALYSLAPSVGTANVNQITNAIAASLSSNGDPSSLVAGTTNTASTIATADTAYSTALGNMRTALGVTGSIITGSFSAAYDKLLDNLTVDVRKNAGVVMTTSAGMQTAGNDLLENAVSTTPYTSAFIASATLPQASIAADLPALSAANMISVDDLEYLRSKLQACFAIPSTQRGTPSSPNSLCAGLDSPSGDYLHAGFYWLDTTSGCSSGPFCNGLLGHMLSQATYDNLKFNIPQIIRPLDNSGSTWLVKFPIAFSDGSIASFGEAIGSSNIVVKKYTPSGSDPGWRFYGDQRVVNSYIEANSQRIENVFTGDIRYETGFNIHINANLLRAVADRTVRVQKVTVTDLDANPVLPRDGITLYNRGSGTGSSWRNSCGGFLTVSRSPTPTGCNGVLRLAYSFTGSYGISGDTVNSAYVAFWPTTRGSRTINNVAGYLSDDQIKEIKPGRSFQFVIELSNGTSINYVNRVHATPQDTVDNVVLEYPLFKPETKTAMRDYLGGNRAFVIDWLQASDSRPFSSAIYWQLGSFSRSTALTQAQIDAKSVSIACTGAGADDCGNASNWGSSGLAQIRARKANGSQVFSQIRQY
jgi:hypothetical protein